jgi:hypothetical protein
MSEAHETFILQTLVQTFFFGLVKIFYLKRLLDFATNLCLYFMLEDTFYL